MDLCFFKWYWHLCVCSFPQLLYPEQANRFPDHQREHPPWHVSVPGPCVRWSLARCCLFCHRACERVARWGHLQLRVSSPSRYNLLQGDLWFLFDCWLTLGWWPLQWKALVQCSQTESWCLLFLMFFQSFVMGPRSVTDKVLCSLWEDCTWYRLHFIM